MFVPINRTLFIAFNIKSQIPLVISYPTCFYFNQIYFPQHYRLRVILTTLDSDDILSIPANVVGKYKVNEV